MSDSSYGMTFNVGVVGKDGKLDAGVKYSDSNGFKFDKSYKDMDEDKAFDLASKDFLAEYAKFAKQLAAEKAKAKASSATTSAPTAIDSRLRELEEANRKLVEQNKRLQDRLAAKEKEQAPQPEKATLKKEEKPKEEKPKPKPVKTGTSYKTGKRRTEGDAYRDMIRTLNDILDGRTPRIHTYDDVERLWDKYLGW